MLVCCRKPGVLQMGWFVSPVRLQNVADVEWRDLRVEVLVAYRSIVHGLRCVVGPDGRPRPAQRVVHVHADASRLRRRGPVVAVDEVGKLSGRDISAADGLYSRAAPG